MSHYHMISTTDPITGRDIPDVTGHPHVVEGDHYHDLTIYFESEETREAYLNIPIEHPGSDLSINLDNPTDEVFDAN